VVQAPEDQAKLVPSGKEERFSFQKNLDCSLNNPTRPSEFLPGELLISDRLAGVQSIEEFIPESCRPCGEEAESTSSHTFIPRAIDGRPPGVM